MKPASGAFQPFLADHSWGYGVSVVTRPNAAPGEVGAFG